MNTPDLAPKNGDFVAYIEELQKRQLHPAAPPEIGASAAARAGASTPSLSTQRVDTAGAQPALIGSLPIGLFAIGIVLLVVGALLKGAIILLFMGIVVLWQAIRVLARNVRNASGVTPSQARQQVANLLAARVQRKKPAGK
jgi:hypothetical protein